jgi:hypothetical protein
VRFGGWPLPASGHARGLSATLLQSLAGHVPTAWAASGQNRVSMAQTLVCHGPPGTSSGGEESAA